LDDLRLEGAVHIARHVDLNRADLGEHRLGPRAISGVAETALDAEMTSPRDRVF
jgi:hypothetical protein